MVVAPVVHSSLAIVAILCCFIANSEGERISVGLIHRDSPISPFYNPHETSFQRIEKALNRSINRINYLSSGNNNNLSAYSKLIPDNNGEYLMKFSIGTPPFQILLIMDTGSDVIWTKCSAFPNKGILFTPALSSTYKSMSCPSRDCDYLGSEGSFCNPNNDNVCHYKIIYNDQSRTLGDFAFETLTMESMSAPHTVVVENTLIVCSYDTKLTYQTKSSGFVGLGRGPASLINQLGSFVDWRFSYCLPSLDGESTIDFGRNVMGDGVVSTPLIDHPSSFVLRLEAISVGNVRIPFWDSFSKDQNIIIDSGTVFTRLPDEFFYQLSSEVARQMVGMKRVGKSLSSFFSLCYKVGPADGPINAPPITINFLGADVELPLSSVFTKISSKVTCFTFLPNNFGLTIYGNFAQRNFLIGYDLQNKIVSFKPSNCDHK